MQSITELIRDERIAVELRLARVVNLRGNFLRRLPENLNAIIPFCTTLNLLENPIKDVSSEISVRFKLLSIKILFRYQV